MPMNANEIETLIKEALPDAQVEIRDLAGDGDHYARSETTSPTSSTGAKTRANRVLPAESG